MPTPPYRIETPRLVIRCFEPKDAPQLKAAIDASLDHLRPWLPWAEDEPEELDQKVEHIRQFRGRFDLDQDYLYGIFDRNDIYVLGGTGLHTRVGQNAFEIGYWIRTGSINQGLATETSAALTKVAFEIAKVDRLEIHCDPANVRSAAVPRKLGYTHEATLRRRLSRVGPPRDTMIWTLFTDEYPSSPAAQAVLEAFDALGRKLL